MSEIILYTSPDGVTRVEVHFEGETFWLSQRRIAELFGVDVRTISEHLGNIYLSEELARDVTIRKFRIVQLEGGRKVEREVDHYSLDAIIAVGYRVNSKQATQFRIWATATLKEPETPPPSSPPTQPEHGDQTRLCGGTTARRTGRILASLAAGLTAAGTRSGCCRSRRPA